MSKNSSIEQLITRLNDIRDDLLDKEQRFTYPSRIQGHHKSSAKNLIHYLAFRTMDIRNLQFELTELGLSSLSRPERKVMASINILLKRLYEMLDQSWDSEFNLPVDFKDSKEIYETNIENLLGPKPSTRRARIMVTLPTEAAWNYELVEQLLENGMNCARINCAHDNEEIWQGIISNIKRAETELGKPCLISMDLAGPKLRTEGIEPDPVVQRAKPIRNEFGQVVESAKVVFYSPEDIQNLPEDLAVLIPVSTSCLEAAEAGDTIQLKDARESRRKLRLLEKHSNYILAECNKTTYFCPGLNMVLKKSKSKDKIKTRVGDKFAGLEGFLKIFKDDLLILKKNKDWSAKAPEYEGAKIIDCNLPEFLEHVKIGESIKMDDGKIGGTVADLDDQIIKIRISQAKATGTKLRNNKGINLPDTRIDYGSMTEKDYHDLEFVFNNADIICLSFVNSAKDVEDLIRAMNAMQARQNGLNNKLPSVVFKIETQSGFNNLPQIILAGMQLPSIGVMIARGDLAIECGFGRLAELQEEILWICEASHIPVIWATQVLEGLAKEGLPSRSEISDAAMGQRAECIMLNKGEYIVEATHSLKEILVRMQDHQTKKRSLHRKLNLAVGFFNKETVIS